MPFYSDLDRGLMSLIRPLKAGLSGMSPRKLGRRLLFLAFLSSRSKVDIASACGLNPRLSRRRGNAAAELPVVACGPA